MEHHPDHGGEARKFILIRAAYEIICRLHKQEINEEIPIPNDLREVINAIILDFRFHNESIEKTINKHFDVLETYLLNYIRESPRRKLIEFNSHFTSEWNNKMNEICRYLNQDSQRILNKYEKWFDQITHDMKTLFDDDYKKQLRNFKKEPMFYIFAVLTLVVAILFLIIWHLKWYSNLSISLAITTILTPFFWTSYCQSKKKNVEDIKSIRVISSDQFDIPKGADFYASSKMKKGVGVTVGAGIIGAQIGSMLGGTIEGAVIGGIVGEVYNRIKHPTSEMKQLLLVEVQEFIATAKPEVIRYAIRENEKFVEKITDRIITNYTDRMQNTVKMLTS